MEIRQLNQTDDLCEISRIYEESWKFAYRGIVPQDYLDSIKAGSWVEYLGTPGRHSLVITEGGEYLGTASYSPSRSADSAGLGEIISLYLLPRSMGKGYGIKLLKAALEELEKLGYAEVFLWVLEENARARSFYEKAGFLPSGQSLEVNIGGKPLREVQYRYRLR